MRRMNSVETRIRQRFLFGIRIKVFRKEQRLTQEQLGTIVGLDRSVISRIECGKSNATFDTILLLAEGLGTTPAELLHGIDLPSQSSEPSNPWL